MENKRKILFCLTSQFGYHTDTYSYCRHLDPSRFEVHYAGFDLGYPRRLVEGVRVHYIPVHPNRLLRYIIFLSRVRSLILKERFDLLFLVDCQVSLPLRLLHIRRRAILDIRTGDVLLKEGKFSWFNAKIRLTSLFFRRITVISDSLREVLHLPVRKCHLLPLGADRRDIPDKTFEKLTLLYIGTLNYRNIDMTVEGLALFLKQWTSPVPVLYHIVGFGYEEYENRLKECIARHGLQEFVIFHGRKNHDEIENLFIGANVGVVFVPITPGYTCQPTTKLYECLLAGMPVIATRTLENESAVSPDEGVLIDDTAMGFAAGLGQLLEQSYGYHSVEIRKKYEDDTWEAIVQRNLEPFIENVLNRNTLNSSSQIHQ